MDWAAPFLGLVMIVAAIGYAVWRAWGLFRRGHKDHVWIFSDANTAALFLGVVVVTHAIVRLLSEGATPANTAWTLVALILIPAPHFIYTAGRLSGIWQRSRAKAVHRSAK